MINDPVLLNDWHVIARTEDVPEGKLVGVRLLGENLVLWKVNDQILAWRDLCIHRGTRLSLGRIEDKHVKTSAGPKFAIYFAVTPVEEVECLGWMWLAMNYGDDVPEEDLRGFEDRIVAQDIPIVESQRPELLPLDLQAELHLRCDRTAIAYRRYLRELGVMFGTA